MSEIRQVTDENYQEVFRAGRVLLVAYARTCPDSMRMVEKALPEFMKTSGEGESGTTIAVAPIKTLNKPDMENPRLAEWLGIEGYPTLYLIADGKILSRK